MLPYQVLQTLARVQSAPTSHTLFQERGPEGPPPGSFPGLAWLPWPEPDSETREGDSPASPTSKETKPRVKRGSRNPATWIEPDVYHDPDGFIQPQNSI